MDVGIALEFLLGTGVEYGSAATYSDLVRTWRDPRPLPSLAELQAAWAEVLSEQAADAQEQVQADTEKRAVNLSSLVSILAQIQARQTEIAADLLLLPTATVLQQRQIVARLLTAQDAILSLLVRIGKALSRLV